MNTDLAIAKQTQVSKKVKTRGPLKKIKRHWQLYLVIALPFAFLVTFNYIPMTGAQIAFRNYNPVQGIWHSPWIGMQEFSFFYHSPYFWPVIRNTLTISIYSLLVGTPAAVILALALNEVKHERFKRTVQMFTYAPYFISTVVMVGMMEIILSPSAGVLGQIAHLFGIQNVPNVLGSSKAFPSLYVWSGVWQETGYGAVIYLAALSNVNPELYEAAKIDGASRMQKIWHIDLTAIRPTIIILFILAVGGILGVGFEKAFLLQNSLNLGASEIISTYTYKMGLVDANFSFAAAVGLMNSVIGFVLILIVNFVARRVSETSLF
ncbi:ABC transporter permease [Alicyclobacillus fodiniaquatilis]|uniref:ABC transporter permease n=1 Tax=Alicyclobacillus fodiniaquatilis TaxID=1661150 RepID=A0ABW4JS93_9BACL